MNGFDVAGLLIPVIFIGLAVTVLVVIITFARNYVKCAPNEVLVVYGRKKKTESGEKGYRLITGGATFVWPIFESYERISLDTFQVDFRIEDSPNVDGVPVTVEALANLKISSTPELLANAVERLLELGNDPARLEQASRAILEGQLRMIVGTLKVEAIIQDREAIAGSVLSVAKTELNKLGLEVDIFVIQKISDKHGYIEALGKKATAEVKKEAAIGEAEAKREETIKTAEADRAGRIAAAQAKREAETAEAEADQAISDANRARDEQIAANDALVKSKQARIEIAAQTAAADESKKLKVAQVSAEQAETEARIKLQEVEERRMNAELNATVIVKAQKEGEAEVIRSSKQAEAAIQIGEATRIQREKQGLGEKAYHENASVGRMKAAEALQKEKEAEAAGQKALLIAEADGTRAKGEAEGTAIQSRLLAEAKGLLEKKLAEAKGIEQMNAALANMGDEGFRYLMMVLAPSILQAQGEAGERIAGAIAEPIGTAIGGIDEIRIMDMGNGSNGKNGNFLTELLEKPVETLTKLAAKGDATGLDMSGLIGMLKADPNKLLAMIGGNKTPEVSDGNNASA